jgi:hypothetical protein
VTLAIGHPPPTSLAGSLTASRPVRSWHYQTGGAKLERSIRTRGALAEQRATRGTPGIACRAPASVTPRCTAPNADGRRRDRHDHGNRQERPRGVGRASRAGQAERRAYRGVLAPAYGGSTAERTPTPRPLMARIEASVSRGSDTATCFRRDRVAAVLSMVETQKPRQPEYRGRRGAR